MTLTNLQPPEGRWARYQREVKEARDFLAPFQATLSGDALRAYLVIDAWTKDERRKIPPEPEASRLKTHAAMRKAGTWTR